jgi:PTS hybrid protein
LPIGRAVQSPAVVAQVGIVLVSHSPQLALGLRALIEELGPGCAPRIAAGTEDGAIGTSYALVAEAIATAERGAGVVVLADLGSAVLTTRMVLTDSPCERVVLVDAPFVEGAVAAAMSAVMGADLAAVTAAARAARDLPKF